jgi:DnaA family protein
MTNKTNNNSFPQLALGMRLRDEATFSNFFAGSNMLAVQNAQSLLHPVIFLWGAKGVGRSHLLQAACAQAGDHGAAIFYCALDEVKSHGVEVLHDLEQMHLVCLDNVQAVVGDAAWEEALFHLFNRLRDSGACLMMAADVSPRELPIQLPDLKSRLTSAVVFHLQELTEDEKIKVLKMRAHLRGLELTDDVCQFIVKRSARDMQSLLGLLERLDQQSLLAKRKITIAFVKEVLGW